jgi:hypothetical protein
MSRGQHRSATSPVALVLTAVGRLEARHLAARPMTTLLQTASTGARRAGRSWSTQIGDDRQRGIDRRRLRPH